MLESIMPEVAYKCDLCGELFNSPQDAQEHDRKAHVESVARENSGRQLWELERPLKIEK